MFRQCEMAYKFMIGSAIDHLLYAVDPKFVFPKFLFLESFCKLLTMWMPEEFFYLVPYLPKLFLIWLRICPNFFCVRGKKPLIESWTAILKQNLTYKKKVLIYFV